MEWEVVYLLTSGLVAIIHAMFEYGSTVKIVTRVRLEYSY